MLSLCDWIFYLVTSGYTSTNQILGSMLSFLWRSWLLFLRLRSLLIVHVLLKRHGRVRYGRENGPQHKSLKDTSARAQLGKRDRRSATWQRRAQKRDLEKTSDSAQLVKEEHRSATSRAPQGNLRAAQQKFTIGAAQLSK